MFILLGMAGKAILRSASEKGIFMAVLTGSLGMFSGELEICQSVIEAGFFPAGRGMALSTILSKLSLVSVVFLVAGGAFLRRGLEIHQLARAGMTVLAARLGMTLCQRKRQVVVIEGSSVSLNPVMAIQAGFSEICPVRIHVCLVKLSMALPAGRGLELSQVSAMAVLAQKDRAIVMLLVRAEGKMDGIHVGKFFHIQQGELCITSPVIAMAACAVQTAALRQHDEMEILGVLLQVDVARQAAICHVLARPESGVAGLAVPGNFSVRVNSLQRRGALLGI